MNYYKPSTELQREAEQVITNITRLTDYKAKRKALDIKYNQATQALVEHGLNNDWTTHQLARALQIAERMLARGHTFTETLNAATGVRATA